MDSGQTYTAADIRKMNRDELNAAAESQGLNPADYPKADDLRDELLVRAENGGTQNDDVDPIKKQETSLTSPDRTTTLKAVVEPVVHDKGRRIVNVVRSASITSNE